MSNSDAHTDRRTDWSSDKCQCHFNQGNQLETVEVEFTDEGGKKGHNLQMKRANINPPSSDTCKCDSKQ